MNLKVKVCHKNTSPVTKFKLSGNSKMVS